MPSEDPPEMRGIEMGRQEIDETLYEQGHGTLALTRDGEAYGVPVSFGYDGETVFLYLIQFGESGKKFDYADATERATLTTYTAESKFRWKSVIVTGTLGDLPDDEIEHMESVMDDNAWFPGMFPPTEPVTAVRRTTFSIEEATGRKGLEFQG